MNTLTTYEADQVDDSFCSCRACWERSSA